MAMSTEAVGMGTSMVKVREGPGGGLEREDCSWREEGFEVLVVVLAVVDVLELELVLLVVVVVVEFWSAFL